MLLAGQNLLLQSSTFFTQNNLIPNNQALNNLNQSTVKLDSPKKQHLLPTNNFLKQINSSSRNKLTNDFLSSSATINLAPPIELKHLGLSLNRLNNSIRIGNKNERNEFINTDSTKNKFVKQNDLENIFENYFGDLINTIENAIEKSEIRYLESERREIIKNEWSDVAMILDYFLCYFFSFLTIITCTSIFLSSPHTLSSL